jgi:hypothetical protein
VGMTCQRSWAKSKGGRLCNDNRSPLTANSAAEATVVQYSVIDIMMIVGLQRWTRVQLHYMQRPQ